MTRSGVKYHVVFEDPASGESLGLMLSEQGGRLGRVAQLGNPYAAKVGGGPTTLADLTDLSVYAWEDWRGGRGEEIRREPDRFYDSRSVETRIARQLTLGPAANTSQVGTTPMWWFSSNYPHRISNAPIEFPEVPPEQAYAEYISMQRRFAARIKMASNTHTVTAIAVRVYRTAGTGTTTLTLHESDSSGIAPATAAVATATATPTTTDEWVTFTFSSPVAVTAGGYYWVVLTPGDISIAEYWWAGVQDGARYALWSATLNAWVGYAGRAFHVRVTGIVAVRFAQSFEAPTGGLACTGVRVRLRKTRELAQDYTVALYSDSGGSPDTLLKSATITDADLGTTWTEVRVTWVSEALASETVYWIVVDYPATPDDPGCAIEWGGWTGYSGGSAKYQGAGGSWTVLASTRDMAFKVNDGPEFGDAITVRPQRFNSGWYCAAGAIVYKWNSSTSVWEASESTTGTVTDMVTWGDYLWVARGNNTMRRLNTTGTWSDAPGAVTAHLLVDHAGYLFRTDPTALEDMYYTGNGTDWTGPVHVGPGDWGINDFVGFGDEIAAVNDVGLWFQSVDWAYPVLRWDSLEDGENGRGMIVWVRSGELYIPVRFGLYKWNRQTMVAIGPDQDAGLPADRAGRVTDLVGTVNWLFAAVDAGASGTSSILAYNGAGWHEIVRAGRAADRIRAMGYETLSSPARLWWAEGKTMRYAELPDYSDNPYAYTGVEFASSGEIILGWCGSELLHVLKDWRAITLNVEGAATGAQVHVHYEVDHSGRWDLLGIVADSRTLHRLNFPSSSFPTKVTGSGSTSTVIELSAATTDIRPGDWVRINDEVRQVVSRTSDTITLAHPLTAEPRAGTDVLAAAPLGSECRIKLEFVTYDSANTPVVRGLAVYCQANVIDRWVITLNVEVSDHLRCLDGSPYPLDAEALDRALQTWIERDTSFLLRDIRGRARLVKVVNANEVQPARRSQSSPAEYDSVVAVSLMEVKLDANEGQRYIGGGDE